MHEAKTTNKEPIKPTNQTTENEEEEVSVTGTLPVVH